MVEFQVALRCRALPSTREHPLPLSHSVLVSQRECRLRVRQSRTSGHTIPDVSEDCKGNGETGNGSDPEASAKSVVIIWFVFVCHVSFSVLLSEGLSNLYVALNKQQLFQIY